MELEGYRIRRLRQFHSPISGVPLSPPAAVWKEFARRPGMRFKKSVNGPPAS